MISSETINSAYACECQCAKPASCFDVKIIFDNAVLDDEYNFLDKNHKKWSYNQSSMEWIYYIDHNAEWSYDDVIDLCNDVAENNQYDLAFNLQRFKQELGDLFVLFIDRMLFLHSDFYSLKANKAKRKKRVFYNFNSEITQLFEYIALKNCSREFATILQDMPPNILNADKFCQMTKTRLEKYENLKIKTLNRKQMTDANLNLILAVNQASKNEPRLMVIRYDGDPNDARCYAVVGKGITFDSGDYALKSWNNMQMMKFDMSGAAIACSLMEVLAKQKPKINVVAIACLTDNLIGGNGMVEDSVIVSKSGLSVEIENTDCEGRLVLTDGVTYAIKDEHASHVITIATLTGAVGIALGAEFSGCCTNDVNFYNQLKNACALSQERVWRLPLTRINTKNQKHSRIADIWNEAPSAKGGSSNGAGFIQQFVEKKPFIHLDIAETAQIERHGTGVMLSTLSDLFTKVLVK